MFPAIKPAGAGGVLPGLTAASAPAAPSRAGWPSWRNKPRVPRRGCGARGRAPTPSGTSSTPSKTPGTSWTPCTRSLSTVRCHQHRGCGHPILILSCWGAVPGAEPLWLPPNPPPRDQPLLLLRSHHRARAGWQRGESPPAPRLLPGHRHAVRDQGEVWPLAQQLSLQQVPP